MPIVSSVKKFRLPRGCPPPPPPLAAVRAVEQQIPCLARQETALYWDRQVEYNSSTQHTLPTH